MQYMYYTIYSLNFKITNYSFYLLKTCEKLKKLINIINALYKYVKIYHILKYIIKF